MPIDRNGGQYITANPQQPTQSSAPGIWDIDEQGSAQAAGRWPLPPNVVQRSLRFNIPDSSYLSKTFVAGNRKTWVWSAWVKRSGTGAGRVFSCFLSSNDQDRLLFGDFFLWASSVGGTQRNVESAASYRDYSAWYHLVIAADTTNSTNTKRIRMYVNGSEVTYSSASYPPQNQDLNINSAQPHTISSYSGVDEFVSCYMAEINFVGGYPTGYDQTSFASLNVATLFGQTDAQTGQWIPRVYSGSYGTNGFRLQFLDNSGTTATTLGKDTSGMGNNWTPNNFSVAAGSGNDSLRDVPMNYYSPDNGLGGEVIGNYCTWNPLNSFNAAKLANGNLDTLTPTGANYNINRGTTGITSGKWYYEMLVNGVSSTQPYPAMGFSVLIVNDLGPGVGASDTAAGYFKTGVRYQSGSSASYGASFTTGDIIGAALDLDSATKTVTFYKNGVSQGAITVTGSTFFPCQADHENSYGSYNFGQRPFAYTAPSGFKALCTQNLSAPRIGNVAVSQANDYFNATLYTGTGSSLSVTGTGFQPDLVWIKSRSAVSSHALYDAVRGVQKQLISNSTADESTQTTGLTAFGSDGFTIGSLAQINTNAATYVAWQWNAGGSTVTNTQGTLSTQLRASPTAGFSIATFTGAAGTKTFGHGLGVAPSFIITKYRIESGLGAGPWYTYHVSLGNTQYVSLNSTGAATTSASTWNNTTPTADLVTLGSSYASTSDTFVAYCFAAVPGFSAFGSYTGNGSADGPFVYLGFRPRWLLIRRSDTIENWNITDAARDPYNPVSLELYPNLTNADGGFANRDFLSNGFKIRGTGGGFNTNGGTYIYAAFAEFPFQFANAR